MFSTKWRYKLLKNAITYLFYTRLFTNVGLNFNNMNFFISLQERVNKVKYQQNTNILTLRYNNNEIIYVLIAITVFNLIIIVKYLTQYQG